MEDESAPTGEDKARAQLLFLEGSAELRGGQSVSKAVKILTEAAALDREDAEIAGALWEAERELAAVLFENAKALRMEGREAEAGKSEMRAKLAEERAEKLDAICAGSEWRASIRASQEIQPPPKVCCLALHSLAL